MVYRDEGGGQEASEMISTKISSGRSENGQNCGVRFESERCGRQFVPDQAYLCLAPEISD